MAKLFSSEPIFIGGCGRSGTTLLLSMLSAHQDIYALPIETAAFNIWTDGEKYPRNYHRLCRSIMKNKVHNRAKRWLEKTPANVLNFSRIDGFYQGKVKCIHIVRDGRDVTTSIHPKAPDRFWVPINRWVLTVNKGLDMLDHPNVLTVKYEELTNKPEETVREICDFLSLEYSEDIINWMNNTQIKKDPAWFGEVKNVHAHSTGRWKESRNRKHLEIFYKLPEAVATLTRAGYSIPVKNE